jgi:hypothetical protein
MMDWATCKAANGLALDASDLGNQGFLDCLVDRGLILREDIAMSKLHNETTGESGLSVQSATARDEYEQWNAPEPTEHDLRHQAWGELFALESFRKGDIDTSRAPRGFELSTPVELSSAVPKPSEFTGTSDNFWDPTMSIAPDPAAVTRDPNLFFEEIDRRYPTGP